MELLEQRHHTSLASGAVAARARGGPASFRILLVDDNADDRLVAIRELGKQIPDVAVTEVFSSAAFEKALASTGGFDLLITDYQLFWSDGLKIIDRVKARWPHTPILMVTGSGNEEVAVMAMKAGVHDYFLKTPKVYARLGAVVRAAMLSRERVADESRYKTLFDTVPVGLFRCTPHGKLLDVNPAFAAILESRREDLIDATFVHLHPERVDFERWRDQLEREGSVAWVETRMVTMSGDMRWVKIHAKALRDPKTHEVIYEGSVEDITSSKEAEVERESLITELQTALGKVRTLTGLLPICASCKKIRDGAGHWNMLEVYIEHHSHAHFTHSFCPECARRLYPEVFLDTSNI